MASTRGGIKIGGKKRVLSETFRNCFQSWLKGLKINWFASREITKPTEVLKPGLDQSEIYHFFILARDARCYWEIVWGVLWFLWFFHLQSSDSGLLHRGSCKFCYLLATNVCFLIRNWVKSVSSFKICHIFYLIFTFPNNRIQFPNLTKLQHTHSTIMNFPETRRYQRNKHETILKNNSRRAIKFHQKKTWKEKKKRRARKKSLLVKCINHFTKYDSIPLSIEDKKRRRKKEKKRSTFLDFESLNT